MSKNEPPIDQAKSYYNDSSFWSKLSSFARNLGEETIEKLLTLYYCFQDPATPKQEKMVIAGALGYFIMPFDGIPDLLPGGWTDDMGVLALAIAKVTASINHKHIAKAKEKLNKLLNTS
ncbi:YkvA family protein [Kangiella shandongensis]|uniref:YkvA family protein n=1 Tax=Kangiella shandongensis TaxID=2763258 RepID=UPI001CBF5169|nr:YkvA family protein [Kangiella shandongensis]